MNERADHGTPVKKREIFGWCCFDFANSAFTTVIITVVFSVYFHDVVAGGRNEASAWWSAAIAISQIIVILFSPLVGAMADLRARKKRYLLVTAMVCSVATASLFFVGAGQVIPALILVMVANTAFSFSENICAGFLPEISTPATAGKISGYGWSFGYIGGLVSLLLAMVIFKSGEGRATWTFLMTGIFFMAASLPTLTLLRERAVPRALPPGEKLWNVAWKENFGSLKGLMAERTLAAFFLSLLFFTAGLSAVVNFAAVFATKVLRMEQTEILGLFVVLQIAGVAGAYGFGFIQDKRGPKFALTLSLLLWIVVCVWGGYCQSKMEFYGIGVIAGIAMGSLQSAGRAVVSTFTPEGKSGEYFGFWGFFTKLAAVVGVPVFGVMATAFGYREAILANTAFFVIGLLVLLPLSLDRRKVEA